MERNLCEITETAPSAKINSHKISQIMNLGK